MVKNQPVGSAIVELALDDARNPKTKPMTLVEFARKIGGSIVDYKRNHRNLAYKTWADQQSWAVGQARVDMDTRPYGHSDCIFSNYDYYADTQYPSRIGPGTGFYKFNFDDVSEFRKFRIKELNKIIINYEKEKK